MLMGKVLTKPSYIRELKCVKVYSGIHHSPISVSAALDRLFVRFAPNKCIWKEVLDIIYLKEGKAHWVWTFTDFLKTKDTCDKKKM